MKFTAVLFFALISLMMCVHIRQEHAPVQTTTETTPVEATAKQVETPVEKKEETKQEEAPVDAHPEAKETPVEEAKEVTPEAKQDETTPVETEAKKEEAPVKEAKEITPEAKQDEPAPVETEAKKEEAPVEEAKEVTPIAKQDESAPVETEAKKEEAPVEEAKEVDAKLQQEGDSGEIAVPEAKVEAKAESKAEVKAKVQVKANQPEAEHTTLKVLTRAGTTKNIIVADSSKDLENSRNCQRDNLNNPVIQLCANLICDECLNSEMCGWCGESAKCMAGNPGDALCPGDCLNHWFFHDQTNCPRLINSGSFSNVAPDATKLINPELAVPKLKVVTQQIDEAKLTVEVVTGQQQTTTSSRTLDADGIVDEVHQAQQTPMTSDLTQKAPTETITTEVTTDLQTGERLDLPDTEIKTHGVNQVI